MAELHNQILLLTMVKFHIITLTYSPVELSGRGSFQLVRVVQVVEVVKLHIYLSVCATLIEQEAQWLFARAKNVCGVFIMLRIKVERK